MARVYVKNFGNGESPMKSSKAKMKIVNDLQKLVACNGDTYSSYEVMDIVRRAMSAVEGLTNENFSLAAVVCPHFVGGEHGEQRCKEIDRLAAAAAENHRLAFARGALIDELRKEVSAEQFDAAANRALR